jgi:hypothetical protein
LDNTPERAKENHKSNEKQPAGFVLKRELKLKDVIPCSDVLSFFLHNNTHENPH